MEEVWQASEAWDRASDHLGLVDKVDCFFDYPSLGSLQLCKGPMVNATTENGCCDAAPEISTLTPAERTKSNSSSKPGPCDQNVPQEIEARIETPSPVGSECWCNPNSGDALIRARTMLEEGASLIDVLETLCPGIEEPPEGWSDHLIMALLTEWLDRPPRREKLSAYNSFEDAVDLFRTRKRILILTGAGVSVSCGIPDFRSRDGIYARLHVDYPDLPDPTAMFDIRYFIHNPSPFYDFASEIFPGQFEPSISHKFIRQLEMNGQLLRNYTQNIDTLERQAEIERVVECHGSFSKATCLNCSAKFNGDVIKDDVMAKRVAHCPRCTVGVIKPDIVFFGEDLGKDFHIQMAADKDEVDLLVVIGSSLKVRPVSLIPFSVDRNVPQILINREPLSSYRADIELLGNCDEIIEDICIALGGGFVDMLESHQNKMMRNLNKNNSESKETMVSIETARNGHSETCETAAVDNRLLRKRRRVAEKQEFVEIMKKLEISEHIKRSEDPECESAVKRPKLEDMYERRYIRVEKHLPEHTYFQISPNRAIFPGAELYYDLETGAICQPMNHRPDGVTRFEVETDDDDDDDDDGSSDGVPSRAGSLPETSQVTSVEDVGPRSVSCEPSVDLHSRIAINEFHTLLNADEYEEEQSENSNP
ncbi:hypothetical protein KIN20_005605 [Parelaphostrongylus tenuis]|uniref:NAD-dependent protein deacetylase sir-2.1 n=1 Tax=Parelaphostrongylus tenuis TaxID=148309 RepID=A0AAD5MIZ4_PARTN|nr:hypothetical protein KIN20_005605 [Parelaphostrongylus tenuis]